VAARRVEDRPLGGDIEALAGAFRQWRRLSGSGVCRLGAPHWDAYARGAMFGLSAERTSAHLARAALESIAFQSADVLTAMQKDAGITLSECAWTRCDGEQSADAVPGGSARRARRAAKVLETTALEPAISLASPSATGRTPPMSLQTGASTGLRARVAARPHRGAGSRLAEGGRAREALAD